MEVSQPLPFWFKIDTGGGSVQSMIYIPHYTDEEHQRQLLADWLAHLPPQKQQDDDGGGEEEEEGKEGEDS